jgi:hypothetical protein
VSAATALLAGGLGLLLAVNHVLPRRPAKLCSLAAVCLAAAASRCSSCWWQRQEHTRHAATAGERAGPPGSHRTLIGQGYAGCLGAQGGKLAAVEQRRIQEAALTPVQCCAMRIVSKGHRSSGLG